MKVCGVIAEYNPFHNGHRYQLEQIRSGLGADYIIVVMSGDFLQRGEPAVIRKHLRAEMALRSGADLVIELPVCASTASAEEFADGGIRLLAGLGVTDHICFGAETNAPLLKEIAALLAAEPDPYRAVLRKELSRGLSMPAAREEAVSRCIPDPQVRTVMKQPNNILALEYLKTLQRKQLSIKPYILSRIGSSYHSVSLSGDGFSSASAIRKILENGDPADAAGQIPEEAFRILCSAARSDGFVFPKDLNLLLFYRLFCETEESLQEYKDVDLHLARRILRLRNEYQTFEAFTGLVASKSLPASHVRRALLHILLQIRKNAGPELYVRILGFRKDAKELLTAIKKASSLPVITKIADAPSLLTEKQLNTLEDTVRASNLYEAVRSSVHGTPFRNEYTRPVVLI